MIKVFGIGNPLLEDDGIGVAAAESLMQLEQSYFEVYATEIYVEEALDKICAEDYVIILDAMDINIEPGKLTYISFQEYSSRIIHKKFCHDVNLLDTLLMYHPSIKGELIGIQIASIDYKEGLSPYLNKEFTYIVNEISKHILELVRES